MIQTKQDLLEYLEADKKALGRTKKCPAFYDLIWKYEICLRKCEYYANKPKSKMREILLAWYKYRRFLFETKCNFSIPLNSVGKGLCLCHLGPVIISEYARIGDNCRIHSGVNIGADFRKSKAAPIIGENVYIGPGAKLFGDIRIANCIAIGANAVVNKSFEQENISIAGTPAKKISDRGTEGILF